MVCFLHLASRFYPPQFPDPRRFVSTSPLVSVVMIFLNGERFLDAELTTLLRRAKQVTGTLADRDDQLIKLVDDGNLLLREIQRRRAVIHAVVTR